MTQLPFASEVTEQRPTDVWKSGGHLLRGLFIFGLFVELELLAELGGGAVQGFGEDVERLFDEVGIEAGAVQQGF